MIKRIPFIVAHRGGIIDHGERSKRCGPENTLCAFQRAAALGARHVELDVRLTKDEQVIVLHDTTLKRTTKRDNFTNSILSNLLTGNIASYTLEELKKSSDMRGVWPEEFCPHPEPVPSLQEVLAVWPTLESIQLEVKIENQDTNYQQTLLNKLQEITASHHELESIITSSSLELISEAKKICPQMKRGYVAVEKPKNYRELQKTYELNYLIPNYKWLTKDDVEAASQCGLKTSVWTVNNINYLAETKDWNIWSIITDDPCAFLEKENFNSRL